MNYKVLFHPLAKEELDALDGSVRILVLKQVKKIRSKPELEEDLGRKAGIDLTGYKKIYADKKRIRIVYKFVEGKLMIYIVAIGKREKFDVYKSIKSRE